MAPVYVGHRLVERRYIGALEVTGVYLGVRELFNSAIAILRRFGSGMPYIGNELLVNGDFSNGTTGWGVQNGATLTVTAGVLEVRNNGTTYGSASQNITTVIGKTYTVTWSASRPVGPAWVVINNAGATNNVVLSPSMTTAQQTLVAAGTNISITLQTGNVDGTLAYFDNISVKEVSTTAAHVYLPGVGMLNGLTAGNYLDSVSASPQAVDQPIGLVLDAAGSVGPELILNRFFDNANDLSLSANATVGSGVATIGVGNQGEGVTFLGAALVAGKTYATTFDITESSASYGVRILSGGVTALDFYFSTVGSHRSVFTATVNGNFCLSRASTGHTGLLKIDNISVREVTGIHASQTATQNKPVLRRGAVNLLTYSQDFSNAVWTVNGTGVKTSSAVITTAAISDGVQNSVSRTIAVGEKFTGSMLLSGSGTCRLLVKRFMGGTYEEGVTDITLTATPTWYSATWTCANTGQTGVAISVVRNTGQTATNITSGGAQLELGSTASPYIPTTSAPASASTGPYHWDFDGQTDSLSLGAPLFQMADDFFLSCGAKGSPPTSYTAIFSPAYHSSTPAHIGTLFENAGNLCAFSRNDAGDAQESTAGVVTSGELFVGSVHCVSGVVTASKNGIAGSSVIAPLGITTVNSGAIGLARGFSCLRGGVYASVAIKGATTASERDLINKLVAKLSGITL